MDGWVGLMIVGFGRGGLKESILLVESWGSWDGGRRWGRCLRGMGRLMGEAGVQRVGRGIMGSVVVGELEIWRAAGAG